jgi:glycosyltransferase involved in cell wall biosynthesis
VRSADGMQEGCEPDISILMTAWNTERYVGEALDSICEQKTSRPWEVLFVDDGSSDGTVSIATRHANKLGCRMRVLRHPGGVNRGISASRNLALRHARGALLAFLDSDDIWLPDHLETQAKVLECNRKVAMAYANAERWVHFSEAFDEPRARAATWGENYLPPLAPVSTQVFSRAASF